MSVWSSHYMIDPQEMEIRFSNEDSIANIESIFEEPSEDSLLLIERVRSIMESLPSREADFIDLYYFRKFKQTDIAMIFGVSQPTVCFRLQRATTRIQFILSLPLVNEQEMEVDLAKVFLDDLDIEIMLLMYETTCQSAVASKLEVSQGLVRHRYLRSIDKLKELEGFEVYYQVFRAISENLNILREVQRNAKEEPLGFALL